jgi:protein-tyrosine phosphatase
MSQKRKRVKSTDEMKKILYKHSPKKRDIKYDDEDDVVYDYNPILKRLFLGNYKAARNKKFFKDENVKAVLNCTKEEDVKNHFASSADIEYMRIPVDDSLKKYDIDLMYKFLPAAVEFINKHINVQKNVLLVNCVMGRQRSVTCVIGYLMKYHGMTPKEAANYVVDKRQEALHHGYSVNFEETINRYYKHLKGSDAKKSEMVKGRLFERE